MLLEAGFDAVRTVVLAVRAALVGDTQGAAVYRLAYYAGAWPQGACSAVWGGMEMSMCWTEPAAAPARCLSY